MSMESCGSSLLPGDTNGTLHGHRTSAVKPENPSRGGATSVAFAYVCFVQHS